MSVRIFVTNKQRFLKIPLRTVRAVAKAALSEPSSSLSVVFLNNSEMVKMNRRYTGRETTTDVLAFPLGNSSEVSDEGSLLGEVLVNAQLAKERADGDEEKAVSEALLYLVHGILHLEGYDDHTAEARRTMWRKMRKILSRFGYYV
ncbi:MAG: rRNA maturation RNase YbeY [Planctomycetota bacterium]|nr:rRNA maturation RNase YbeY [Planctomycetota bacterium]